MTSFLVRSLVASLLLGVVSGAAFIPHTSNRNNKQAGTNDLTVMQFKFLKDLGMEKPSWLPDFGGKKQEEQPKAEAPAAEEETEEAVTAESEE